MKAMTIRQPWATLIATGAKPFETRTFGPQKLIGERVAIHAGKMPVHIAMRGMDSPEVQTIAAAIDEEDFPDLPLGAVLCTAVIKGAYRLGAVCGLPTVPSRAIMETRGEPLTPNMLGLHCDFRDPNEPMLTLPVDAFGDYTPGRWAWFLSDIERFPEPISATGKQGWWEWSNGSVSEQSQNAAETHKQTDKT